jgi:hypothetical protein
MSLRGPKASFEAATKHLFRHLREPDMLRKNPLVQRFFETGAATGRSDRCALEQIHSTVRRAAERCRYEDRAAGKNVRAERQHTILTERFFEGRALDEIARSLFISAKHCYREAAEICARIARYIVEDADGARSESAAIFDEFRLLLDHAVRRADLGEVGAAFNDLDGLMLSASSPEEKIEVLRRTASLSIEVNVIARAQRALSVAQAIFAASEPAAAPMRGVCQATLDLMAGELAHHRGDIARGYRLAKSAADRLDLRGPVTAAYVPELYAETLYGLSIASVNLGNLSLASSYANRAEAELRQVRFPSPKLHALVMVCVWRLRHHLAMSAQNWRPSEQRCSGLVTAFEQAFASAPLFAALPALVALTDCYACAGNEAEALRVARFVLLLGNQRPEKRAFAQALLEMTIPLLPTSRWKEALSLLSNARGLSSCDASHRHLFAYVNAGFAYRNGAFESAMESADTVLRSPNAYSVMLDVRARAISAASAQKLGRVRKPRCSFEEIVSDAEGIGSAPLLRDVYGIAAKVTGRPQFERRFEELSRLLAS